MSIIGTLLYCGVGYGIDEMIHHLDEAKKAGVTTVFTSLQLPVYIVRRKRI